MLAATSATASSGESAGDRRRALDDLARLVDDDAETVGRVEAREMAGPAGAIGLRIYSPLIEAGDNLPGLVFFHGGGWVAGGLDTHDGLCRRLANRAGCRVIAVDYRLAPEHPFPAAIEDGLAAVEWAAAHSGGLGIDLSRLAVGGDSAGGGLAAAVCQLVQARGGPKIALQLLICPITDVEGESASRREFAEGYFLSRMAMQRDLADYRPADVELGDPRLSPLRAPDLGGLPPAVVHVAAFDPFRDEGLAYAARLRQAGVAVTSVVHPGMIHYFYAMPRAIPYALTAAEMIGADVRRMIAGGLPETLLPAGEGGAQAQPGRVRGYGLSG